MASKSIQYKITGVPTKEQIEKFDKSENIFYRFQDSYIKLTSRSKSWGMGIKNQREARKYFEIYGLNPDDAILNGKSCGKTFDDIYENYLCWFKSNKDFVLLVFEGEDTGEIGHDGEIVAKYKKKIAVWNIEDIENYLDELFGKL